MRADFPGDSDVKMGESSMFDVHGSMPHHEKLTRRLAIECGIWIVHFRIERETYRTWSDNEMQVSFKAKQQHREI